MAGEYHYSVIAKLRLLGVEVDANEEKRLILCKYKIGDKTSVFGCSWPGPNGFTENDLIEIEHMLAFWGLDLLPIDRWLH